MPATRADQKASTRVKFALDADERRQPLRIPVGKHRCDGATDGVADKVHTLHAHVGDQAREMRHLRVQVDLCRGHAGVRAVAQEVGR
jgi:hypothetical protein